ncbi:V8-like Glu-specific endopeptidase [Streptomyces sp. 846.5]|nr:serine protease [Streptomyces sp. 846.5]TDT98718.1 V8-like Glu-specific endopeptidase [Streptomyces sp. 846.5]
MQNADPGSRFARTRSGRRSRRRILLGITAGIMVGGGLVVATTGAAGASVSLLRSIDTAKRVAATATASASASTGTTESASKSTTASASKTASASASKSATKATASASASKSTAAAPVTTTGQSVTLTSDEQPSQVGAIFTGSISDGHSCTASVVDSPAGDLIVTAAHCLSSGTGSGATFVPGYHDGTAPYGEWKITDVIESSAWTSNQSEDDDVAFAVVAPLNGKSLQSVVGAYSLDTSGVTNTTVQITGYPSDTDKPISGTCLSTAYTSTQLQVDCTGYPSGTSGSGWLENYDASTGSGTLIGVIGGYEQGGDTDDVSYAAVFDGSVQSLYEQAKTAAASS